MGRKAVDPVCCVMHVKETRTLIVKEKGLAPVFLDSRLEHPAGWICAHYKSYHYYYYYPCSLIDMLDSCIATIPPSLVLFEFSATVDSL